MKEYGYNFRAQKVDVHSFAISPKAEIPRSTFKMQHTHKTTFSASNLIPIYLQEILPGDTFNVKMSAFVRMATPIYPIMDNMDLETWFFFVPNRLVWIHWYKFMGEQDLPTDSIAYTIPTITTPAGGAAQLSLWDYFGIPVAGQIPAGNTITVNALPFRAYNLIWNQWFRDENLINSQMVGSGVLTQVGSTAGYGYVSMDDGPDVFANYTVLQVTKRADYFTRAMPWPQKGAAGAIPIITGNAPVATTNVIQTSGTQQPLTFYTGTGGTPTASVGLGISGNTLAQSTTASTNTGNALYPNNLYANLTVVAGNTINALRTAVQTQKLLERDARGGTRYTEIIRNHFGVVSPDQRLMRPELLASGKQPINIAPVPQTVPSYTGGPASPIGTLSGVGLAQARHGFRQSFTEHGYILGLCTVRREQQYQQGTRRLWNKQTRYDFYMPVFAELGEQAILQKEIFTNGLAQDTTVFAYCERWAEYRWHPSYTTAYFNSKNTTPLDSWHLATLLVGAPVFNNTWINDDTSSVLTRVLAGGAADANQQFLADFFFDETAARPMPMYSVPGHMDHF